MKPILYRILRPLINILIKLLFRPKYIGLNNIPKEGKIVLAGNHTHIFDPLLIISSTKRTVHFLAKEELYKGLKGFIFKNMGIIPVNRKIHDKEALSKAEEFLNKNACIGVFPEATINKTKDTVMPFKIGAVKMSCDTNSLLIPFTIKGKYKLFNNKLTIEFFKPYKIKNSDLNKENQKLMNIIINSLETR